jgi:hypothetical protein
VYHRTSQPRFFKCLAKPVKGLKCPSAGKLANRILVPGCMDEKFIVGKV